jgi:hypothetical protein
MVRPEFWGPGTWRLLYSIVFDDENEESTESDIICLLISLQKLIPCGDCREHYSLYLKLNPPEESLGNLKIWVNNFHNSVNDRLKKPRVNIKIIEAQIYPKITPKPNRKLNRKTINVQPATRKPTIMSLGSVSSRAAIKTPVKLEKKGSPQPKIIPTAKNPVTVASSTPRSSAHSLPVPRVPPKKKGCNCGKK